MIGKFRTLIFFVITPFLLAIFLLSCQKQNDYSNAKELIKAMKNRNDGRWHEYYTFKQKTLIFDENEKLQDSAIWLEHVSYPYLFRIDRDLEKGNYTIYRNDSTYHFLNDTLYMAANEPAKQLMYKGGLYFVSLNEAFQKISDYGYDTTYFGKGNFNGVPVYKVGHEKNQFWLNAEHFYCMRRISTSEKGKKTDVVYDDFIRLGNGWVEQKVTFYLDGKKRMEEFYFDIQEQQYIDPNKFEVD